MTGTGMSSISRNLSWKDSFRPSSPSSPKEEQDWLLQIQTLISSGLNNHSQSKTLLDRWHSPESPLDPSLKTEEYAAEFNGRESNKQRQRVSNRKLVYDCVNTILMEISDPDRNIKVFKTQPSSPDLLAEQVWTRMKRWTDGGESNSNVVESLVEEELVGEKWSERFRLEMSDLVNEIVMYLVDELVFDWDDDDDK